MAPTNPSDLTAKEADLLINTFKSLAKTPLVDLDKLATLSNYASPVSAGNALRNLRRKLNIEIDTCRGTPKPPKPKHVLTAEQSTAIRAAMDKMGGYGPGEDEDGIAQRKRDAIEKDKAEKAAAANAKADKEAARLAKPSKAFKADGEIDMFADCGDSSSEDEMPAKKKKKTE